MNTVEINSLKKYSEFTTTFRIPFKKANDVEAKCYTPMGIIDAWKEVCIQALEMRMEACLSMLLKNRDRVIESDEECVVFKKPNGHLHFFNYSSFQAMEALVEALKEEGPIVLDSLQADQLLKALYWIPEKLKKDHQEFGFGELISCLTCLAYKAQAE